MRILSLDLGIKSLGVCVSDPSNIIAIPVENYMFEREEWDSAANRVVELVNEYNVGVVLLGHPLRTDGAKSEMTLISEEFFELLKSKLEIIVKLFDERFSTKRGIELLQNKYNDSEKVKQHKDMAAAYVMLVDYLMYNN